MRFHLTWLYKKNSADLQVIGCLKEAWTNLVTPWAHLQHIISTSPGNNKRSSSVFRSEKGELVVQGNCSLSFHLVVPFWQKNKFVENQGLLDNQRVIFIIFFLIKYIWIGIDPCSMVLTIHFILNANQALKRLLFSNTCLWHNTCQFPSGSRYR